MMACVFPVVGEQHQVFNSIIVWDSIDVVDYL